jgi:hypothetical protein
MPYEAGMWLHVTVFPILLDLHYIILIVLPKFIPFPFAELLQFVFFSIYWKLPKGMKHSDFMYYVPPTMYHLVPTTTSTLKELTKLLQWIFLKCKFWPSGSEFS